MTALLIEDTFDTARMTAFCRALESERKRACFHDPYARMLAGPRGEEIVRKLGGRSAIWPLVVRTFVYDEIITRLAQQKDIDLVINLAAGLDTRPYRLELPASLNWIEIDFPAVLAYKKEKLAREQPACKLEQMALDVTDDRARKDQLTSICKKTKQALVLTEGLLTYLTAEKVAAIGADLRKQQTIHWWLTELISPRAIEYDNRRWNTVVAEEAQTHFTPPGGLEFFQLLGWRQSEFRSVITEGLRLKLSVPHGWLFRLLARLSPPDPEVDSYNAGGFLLLERANSAS